MVAAEGPPQTKNFMRFQNLIGDYSKQWGWWHLSHQPLNFLEWFLECSLFPTELQNWFLIATIHTFWDSIWNSKITADINNLFCTFVGKSIQRLHAKNHPEMFNGRWERVLYRKKLKAPVTCVTFDLSLSLLVCVLQLLNLIVISSLKLMLLVV